MFSINTNKHKIIWEMQFLVTLGYVSIHLQVEEREGHSGPLGKGLKELIVIGYYLKYRI